jgi:hypothetical protein
MHRQAASQLQGGQLLGDLSEIPQHDQILPTSGGQPPAITAESQRHNGAATRALHRTLQPAQGLATRQSYKFNAGRRHRQGQQPVVT